MSEQYKDWHVREPIRRHAPSVDDLRELLADELNDGADVTMRDVVTARIGALEAHARTRRLRYYDLQKNWTRKIEPHLANKQLNDILVRDLNRYSSSHWGKPFRHGQYPWEYGSSEWMDEHRGRPRRYWRYTQFGSCHWLVNFNLMLAMLAEPQRRWRIVTSVEHSTVWDGAEMLFEFNFLAFGIPAQECFDLAFEDGVVLPLGKFRRTYEVPHFSVEN